MAPGRPPFALWARVRPMMASAASFWDSSPRRKRSKMSWVVGGSGMADTPVLMPPNGSRLSCGAKLECSQTEFYHTACTTSSGFVEDGRRQLQAHVRQRGTWTGGHDRR